MLIADLSSRKYSLDEYSAPLGSHATSLVATVPSVRVSHRVDYGVRVMTTLAAAASTAPGRPVTSATLSETDEVPPGFLDDILRPLRIAGLLRSQRGGDGGWLLAKDAATITVADVIRALEGPLASVRGIRPHKLGEAGEREPFVSLWIATRAALRSVLEHVTLADLASGQLPTHIAQLANDPDAWDPHTAADNAPQPGPTQPPGALPG
ncbi:MAG TPA: Rrf2 family transcriptional regulator [Desertimonas sp.]|nr:Rrf2 family transcriptional regulator [Desertimonas sp.]